MRYAFAGVRRFGGWRQHLGISDAVLTARLRALVGAGVLERRRAEGGSRPEYRLAAPGLDLWPLLLSIWSWEQHHVAGQADALPTMVHRRCGSEFEPVLCCRACAAPAPYEDVDLALGPSGDFARSVPVGANRRRTGSTRSDVAGTGLFTETMTLVGSRWSSAVLGAAILGATRFGDFERMVGAPPAIVAGRLRSFVRLGVLEGAAGYRLTAKGRAFFPVVATALAWGERHFPAVEGPAVDAVHRTCGRPFVPALGCSACGELIDRRTVEVSPADVAQLGPGDAGASRG